ncbi:MAG: phosphatidylglycerol lysyltransferase domain-containing protein [Clostridia bacterium]|nr:phosphatidylglycerol lysyltransferase domain-containing protein [Clostridia bacterium]MDE7215784.1 phosphatidylglycerol lysyltransferase domain-containing protein [Clostridia bacterium]
MRFVKISDKDFERIAQLQKKTEYDGSEYSMLYLKGWDFFNYQSMEICDTGDTVFLRFQPHDRFKEDVHDGSFIYLPPLTEVENIEKAYAAIKEQCETDGEDMYVMSTPKTYVDILGDKYTYLHNEDYDEYLYLPQDLITLSGKKYHSKRNHIKNFEKRYMSDCVFRSYEKSDREKVFALINGWEESKEFDEEEFDGMANDELNVIDLALKLVENSDEYFADVVEYQNKIIGFSLGEITPSDVGITHIEKGDVNYEGIYPYLCNAFAKKHFANVRFINRQEDMGLEGLRKSKRSYHPIGFCEKYAVKNHECNQF